MNSLMHAIGRQQETTDMLAKLTTPAIGRGVSRDWGDHAALAGRSFWLACG